VVIFGSGLSGLLEVKSLSQTTRHAVQKKQKHLAHGNEFMKISSVKFHSVSNYFYAHQFYESLSPCTG